MATQSISFPEMPGEGKGVQLLLDQPVPPPAFVDFGDANGTTHRYVPASELESERALNAELVEALTDCVSALDAMPDFIEGINARLNSLTRNVGGEITRHPVDMNSMRAVLKRYQTLIDKAEAREKGD